VHLPAGDLTREVDVWLRLNVRVVYGNACHWIDWRLPGAAFENPHGISKSRLPTRVDSSAGEIDVAQMIFVIEAWRLKPYDVHEGAAATAGHLLDLRCFALRFRHQANEFAYDVAKMMDVTLARDVTVGAVVCARSAMTFILRHVFRRKGHKP